MTFAPLIKVGAVGKQSHAKTDSTGVQPNSEEAEYAEGTTQDRYAYSQIST